MKPASLFKYVPFCDPKLFDGRDLQHQRLEGFEKGEIWYSKACNLNDPFECAPKFEIKEEYIEEVVDSLTPNEFLIIKEETPVESKEKLKRQLEMTYKETPGPAPGIGISSGAVRRSIFFAMLQALKTHSFSRIGILSLTETPLDLIMWAHYGGNNTGICLEFERSPDNKLGSNRTKRVDYLTTRPEILFQDRNIRKEEIITSKFEAWSYEKEWRNWQEEGDLLYPFPGKLVRVIFGVNCAEPTKAVLKRAFGGAITYESTYLGNDYKLYTDCGLQHSLGLAATAIQV